MAHSTETTHLSRREREWDATVYHRVSEPQLAWGLAVLSRLALRGDERALDAGCGTGRLSAHLCTALPDGHVLGVDRSLAMATTAAGTLAGRRACVVAGDLLALPVASQSRDLVFSTATFHWVHDHDALFAELARVLAPGGRLVAQCGGAGNIARVHGFAREAAALPGLQDRFAGWGDPWNYATPEATVERLERAGLVDAVAWMEEAPTRMPDRAACGEFIRTVILRPWLARLDDADHAARFLDQVLDRLEEGPEPWLLDYRRLNMEARRPA